jgi:hypothetical protein
VAGEPGAERRGLVRVVLAELIYEGAGEDGAVAAVRAFNGAAFGRRRHFPDLAHALQEAAAYGADLQNL